MVPVLKLHNINKKYGEREVLNIQELTISGGRNHWDFRPQWLG